MKITGIIAEYNPLHNGHIYHMKKARELTSADAIVCVMSGNFMQRGIPAVIDKWNRTKMALNNGIDLVIELPTVYSLSSAEFFSFGAISLLNSLGLIDNICFGSECGDLEMLKQIAKVLYEEPDEFKNSLKELLKNKYSFAKSRSIALNNFFNSDVSEIVESPNNILGIEYCKSLLKLNSNITPFTIQRKGGSYNSTGIVSELSSATAIRKYIELASEFEKLKGQLPEDVLKFILDKKNTDYKFVFEEGMFHYIKYKYSTFPSTIQKLPDASEGLENRICKNIANSSCMEELIKNIKSKRYAYTRISRILCQYFVGFDNFNTESMRKENCPYARILGFNKKGASILKQAKKASVIPLITKLPEVLPAAL